MELTYDANGNLKSYGEKQYTWNYGKSLGSITDGENTYSYTYNENGIRASKNINGVKTEINTINGKVLSQKTGEDILYFQYDSSDVPVGFVYNDAAYYYITNISNDVVGITDSAGNIIAEYEYDEWGKLISVEAESEEAQTIAQMNPLRYRGYYYDNETGYYYLQSRYYDPGIYRFINADDYKYAEIQKEDYVGFNLFAYCYNEPINNSDYEGFALSESSLITYFIEDRLLKNKYIARRGKTYTDKTGAKVKEIKYRKYFNVYEVVRISYGKKNNWQKGISIANNCSSKTINHYFNVMGNSLINVSASSGKSIGSAMASAAVIIISLSSASKKAATINKYYQKVWGSKGIDPKNKYGYFLICVTKDKKLNGWYIIRSNGRGYKKL